MINLPEDMIIPQNNRDTSNPRNVNWLLRNLGIRNSSHPEYKRVIADLIKLKKEQGRT